MDDHTLPPWTPREKLVILVVPLVFGILCVTLIHLFMGFGESVHFRHAP